MNPIVLESIKTNEPVGYKQNGINKPKSEAETRVEQLSETLVKMEDENKTLKSKIDDLEQRLQKYEMSSPRDRLEKAVILDRVVNT